MDKIDENLLKIKKRFKPFWSKYLGRPRKCVPLDDECEILYTATITERQRIIIYYYYRDIESFITSITENLEEKFNKTIDQLDIAEQKAIANGETFDCDHILQRYERAKVTIRNL